MSAIDLINYVIVIPDPATVKSWYHFSPQRVPANISFSNEIKIDHLQTLSSNDPNPNAAIDGFLYVPDIDPTDPCFETTKPYVPASATRKADLPDIQYNFLALAPWVSSACSRAYVTGAHADPVSAFVFYLLNNDTSQPPTLESQVWDVDYTDVWLFNSPFPIYAVPEYLGVGMMNALSNYSGNVSSVPYGNLLLNQYHLDPGDYVRVFTQIDLPSSSPSDTLPGLWIFFFILIGGVVIMSLMSLSMHILQWWRRRALRRRIASGEVNLETLGVKRLTVPENLIEKMPLFMYTCKAEDATDSKNQDISTNTKEPTVEQISSSSTKEPEQPPSLTAHNYLPHSQPTCPICLDDFVSGTTTIRELPCLHVFHPECIDTFLSKHSSLCPMCKKSTLPVGFCPAEITNPMVVRERAIRRQQESHLSGGGTRERSTLQIWIAALHRRPERVQPVVTNPPPAQAYTGGVAVEMQPVIDLEAPRLREVHPGMSRAEIAQIRAQELLGGSEMEENDRSGTLPRWRKMLRHIFPGFG